MVLFLGFSEHARAYNNKALLEPNITIKLSNHPTHHRRACLLTLTLTRRTVSR
jgi:hypothetical protein